MLAVPTYRSSVPGRNYALSLNQASCQTHEVPSDDQGLTAAVRSEPLIMMNSLVKQMKSSPVREFVGSRFSPETG
jgi:hypothetical protein